MDLNKYLTALREDLLAAAAIGDEDIRRASTLLGAAIEPSARLAIMDALSDLAAEVTDALVNITVDLRLDGRDVRVNVHEHAPERAESHISFDKESSSAGEDEHDDPARAEQLRKAMQEAGGELSRTTVRLFNDLKSQAERAASDQGMSLNTYISRAVSDSVRSAIPTGSKIKHSRGKGRSTTGFIQA